MFRLLATERWWGACYQMRDRRHLIGWQQREERRVYDEDDEAAFDSFYGDAWPRLQGQAYALTGSRELAQDLTQEALLRAWRDWHKVSALQNPEAWTRKVLHNLCIESWRRSRRRPSKHDVPAPVEIPDSHREIATAMRTLPGDQARAVLLHDGLGMSIAEVAIELNAPEGTVKSWLSRARKVLAVRLHRLERDQIGGGSHVS
jgi:RNA polymerase sigma-70 factor (ECF subfamily)